MTTVGSDGNSQLSAVRAFLRAVRQHRPAESLVAKHLEEDRYNVTAIAGSNSEETRERLVQSIDRAIPRLTRVVDLPDNIARDIAAEILQRSTTRDVGRDAILDRHRRAGVSLSKTALRQPDGIEAAILAQLAPLVLEEFRSPPPSKRGVVLNELVFGLTMWLGTSDEPQRAELKNALIDRRYEIVQIKLSDLLNRITPTEFSVGRRDDDLVLYLNERMDAGDFARVQGLGVMAELAIEAIAEHRAEFIRDHGVDSRISGIAYIIDSLMHPEESALLRSTYGSRFFLVAFHEDEAARREKLLQSTGAHRSRNRLDQEGSSSTVEQWVDRLIERNRGRGRRSLTEPSPTNLIAVEKVFHRADVFIDVADPGDARKLADGREVGLSTFTIGRFVDQIFSNPFNTPTRHELGMAHAFVEARRSAAITRQVGAAICREDGELVALGTNEAPSAGGGQYPKQVDGRLIDYRDNMFLDYFSTESKGEEARSVDPNDDIQVELLLDLLAGLSELNIVSDDYGTLFDVATEPAQAADKLLQAHPELLRSRIFDIIEYTRMVHAEMAAILGAMRRGVSVQDCVLYCTTLPCHECARHIIMAGISRVIYVEPYPKSRIVQIHPESTVMGRRDSDETAQHRVEFVPFIGISPSRQGDLYSPLRRRNVDPSTGRSSLVSWDKNSAALRPSIDSADDPQQQALENAARRAKEEAIIKLLKARRKRT